jgi:hypothetical protein
LACKSLYQRIYLCVKQSNSCLPIPCNINAHFCGEQLHIHLEFGHT